MTVNTVTLARISNNDLYGCSTGYQDYLSLKGLIDAQFALVLYYNGLMPLFQLRLVSHTIVKSTIER
jgi:hypothetical protein